MESNPYEVTSSSITQEPPKPHGGERPTWKATLIWGFVYFYPLVLLLGVYGCWMLAWMLLGRPPRPMLDDPKGIGGAMDVAYLFSGILVMASPAMLILGVLASYMRPPTDKVRWMEGTALLVLFFAIWFGVWLLLFRDPWNVVEWYMD